MEIITDNKSGFCFGVKKAIAMAESELDKEGTLYCLGDIVHNEMEVERLSKLGLKVITRNDFLGLSNCRVLLRAHGEPPEIYEYAKANNIELLDGTCPVVTKLQQKVKTNFMQAPSGTSLVIFGKPDHPEVIALNGQIDNKAIIIREMSDLDQINFDKPILLFSQTTMSREDYQLLKREIESRISRPELLDIYDTICGQVANRGPWLMEFSKKVEAVVFVGGKKSSNSKVLFNKCKQANPNSFFISSPDELERIPLMNFSKVGVCGATSTPDWLINEVAQQIKAIAS